MSARAVSEILGVEPGGFAMLVASVVVLALGLPVASRIGRHDAATFRRTGIGYGLVLLVLLFGTVIGVKLAE